MIPANLPSGAQKVILAANAPQVHSGGDDLFSVQVLAGNTVTVEVSNATPEEIKAADAALSVTGAHPLFTSLGGGGVIVGPNFASFAYPHTAVRLTSAAPATVYIKRK
jgi:hypothetical protein